MVLVTIRNQTFYMDGYLKQNLDIIKPAVLKKKNLFVCIVDGRPSTGKSTLVAQTATYLTDGAFQMNDMAFTGDQFRKLLENLEVGNAADADEAFEAMNKRQTQSRANMELLSMLQKVRSKRGFIFITLPFVYDLDKNIILGLCDMFIHCYRKPFGARGQFAAYNSERLKKLWLFGRQTYSYSPSIVRPNFIGRFTSFFPFDYDKYESLKNSSKAEPEKPERSKYKLQRDMLIRSLIESGMSREDIANKLDISIQQIYKLAPSN